MFGSNYQLRSRSIVGLVFGLHIILLLVLDLVFDFNLDLGVDIDDIFGLYFCLDLNFRSESILNY